MTVLSDLPLGPGVLPKLRPVNRNDLIAGRGEMAAQWLRNRPELGLLTGISITTYKGIQAQISQLDERPVDALLAWFYLVDKPLITVDAAYVNGAHVEVRGQVDGCPVRVWACLMDVPAIELLAKSPTVHTLRCLQIEGAR
jgi:hypothetical protein